MQHSEPEHSTFCCGMHQSMLRAGITAVTDMLAQTHTLKLHSAYTVWLVDHAQLRTLPACQGGL